MRAFAAEPKAWGHGGRKGAKHVSAASLNKAFRAACTRAQAALLAEGVRVDLSPLTLYKLKHSQTTAMQIAAPGLVDADGDVRIDPGVQLTVGHGAPENDAGLCVGRDRSVAKSRQPADDDVSGSLAGDAADAGPGEDEGRPAARQIGKG